VDVVVVDAGPASKVDVVGKDGVSSWGVITPGVAA